MFRQKRLPLRLKVGLTLLACVAILFLLHFVSTAGLSGLDQLSSVVSAVLAATSLYLLLLPPDWLPGVGDEQPSAGLRVRPADRLRAAVAATWEPEERRRRLLDPGALALHWTTLGPPLSDHWSNIRSDGREEPIELHGLLHEPGDYNRLVRNPVHRGRLVLLGAAGSGKSSTLLRLTTSLLTSGPPTAPVPVLFQLATWDPVGQSLETWMAERLRHDYGLRQQVPFEDILPVLDGFDEMPSSMRAPALVQINRSFRAGSQVIMSSRRPEYADAVAKAGGEPLRGAAVVQLEPLAPASVYVYLQRTTHPARAARWRALEELDRSHPDHPDLVATALATPLMASLAREQHDRDDADPCELTGFTSADGIHARLLGQLVDHAFPDPPITQDGSRAWPADEARRALALLARQSQLSETNAIAWWEFHRTCLKTASLCNATFVGTVVYALAVVGFDLAHRVALFLSLLAFTWAALFGLASVRPALQRGAAWRRPTIRQLADALRAGLGLGVIAGMVLLGVGMSASSVVFRVALDDWTLGMYASWFLPAVAGGLFLGLGYAVLGGSLDADARQGSSPPMLLQRSWRDAASACVFTTALGLVPGLYTGAFLHWIAVSAATSLVAVATSSAGWMFLVAPSVFPLDAPHAVAHDGVPVRCARERSAPAVGGCVRVPPLLGAGAPGPSGGRTARS